MKLKIIKNIFKLLCKQIANDSLPKQLSNSYSKYDPIIKRATYNVEYPKDDLEFTFEDKKSKFIFKTEEGSASEIKRFVRKKRLSFNLDNATFRKLIFQYCNFHNKHGITSAKIDVITFEDCDFKNNIMGSTIYRRVIFKNCTFNRCDFMNSDFIESIFSNCAFKECTAYHTRFIDSEINPTLFLSGITPPEYNYESIKPNEKVLISREWISVRTFLARQLLKSSLGLAHSKYVDSSILLLKKEETKACFDYFKYGMSKETTNFELNFKDIFTRFSNLFNGIFLGCNIILTNGGTSFKKLLYFLIIFITFISITLSFTQIKYESIPLFVSSRNLVDILYQFIQNIPYSLILFLNISYDTFSPDNNFILLFSAIIGLLWYALLIQLLIRKVYK